MEVREGEIIRGGDDGEELNISSSAVSRRFLSLSRLSAVCALINGPMDEQEWRERGVGERWAAFNAD